MKQVESNIFCELFCEFFYIGRCGRYLISHNTFDAEFLITDLLTDFKKIATWRTEKP